MRTPMDRVLQSRVRLLPPLLPLFNFSRSEMTISQNLFLGMKSTCFDKALLQAHNIGFVGIVTASALWSMWGGDIFPADKDPSGDPETWTFSELRRWLEAVGDVLCDL
jgi:hypothetical protein